MFGPPISESKKPKMSVSNFKKVMFFNLRNSIDSYFYNLKPFGLADLTTSTVLDAVPHSAL
jgi:hypothetical protein